MADKQFEDPGNLIKPQSGLLAGLGINGNTKPSIHPITLQISQIVNATGAMTTRPVRKEFRSPARRPD